jgi:hypothetical protein
MLNLLSELLNSYKPRFYNDAIDLTKDILGIYVPINAPAIAKVAAANLVKKEMKKTFVIPEENTESKYKGGTIVFSTDINSMFNGKKSALNTIENILKLKWESLINKIINDKKLKKITKEIKEKNNIKNIQWNVGNFFKGKYEEKDGQLYNKKSISIYVSNIPSKFLKELAGLIVKEFNQKSILVQDKNVDKIYLLYV